ncbi:hypothetical protein POTOM_057889 [Populus tomentosa]|uniref:GDSL esterase/lipase n=1 Tax=Populus tomentosa TaxID=118781 RepID=A0A8X7Y336_POPTO|nr:hypothetical protein POTOM_057889 [Populus tomentosa]
MAYKIKVWCFLLVLLKLESILQNCANAAPQVPCFYIFGDSLADIGNNKHLVTTAKANYRPYGIDFPNGTTGRSTNGRTTVDIIDELLGFDQFIPPFATARSRDILVGVNYASWAAGIRDESGRQMGDRIILNEQLQNHAATFNRLIQLLGTKRAAAKYLNKCLYYVSLGTNDYINNYFAHAFVPLQSQENCLAWTYTIRQHSLRIFYSIPQQSLLFGNINNAVLPFNAGLFSLVHRLNKELNNARFIYLNISGMSSSDPSVPGKSSTMW